MSAVISYNKNDYCAFRFVSLFKIGTYSDTGYEYEPNLGETISNGMLWPVEKLPAKISECLRDPRVVTIAVSALAMLAVSFAFYPALTAMYTKAAIAALPFPPAWAVKFSCYAASIWTILGYTVRAESRFTNNALMDQVYNKA